MSYKELTELSFSDRNNTNSLQLQDDSADGVTIVDSDLTAATKVEIVFDSLAQDFNSTDNGGFISFTADGRVTLTLGEAGLPRGRHSVYVVVYDSVNLKGIRWQPDFQVHII